LNIHQSTAEKKSGHRGLPEKGVHAHIEAVLYQLKDKSDFYSAA
jgi:hypothetical protein